MLGRFAAALLSGAMLAQTYGLQPWWPLAWIAPIPLLIAVIGASPRGAIACGAIAGATSTALMVRYFLELSGLAPAAVIVLAKAVIWSGVALAVRASARCLPAPAAAFMYPTLMAGIETVIAAISPHGSAGSLAYSQMDFLPAIQIASLGGAPAITFLVSLPAAAVAVFAAKRAATAAAAPALVIMAALGFGYVRLALPQQSESVRASLLVSDQFEGVSPDWRAVWAAYAPMIERAADEDHRLVLLPEKIARLSAGERDVAVEVLSEIARRRDVALIFGVDVEAGQGRFNRLYYVDARSPPLPYDKHHLIPGFESQFTPGREPLRIGQAPMRLGFAVCKDMDFPTLGRSYREADLVLVPAWDFGVDAWLHSRMAMLRGVESGYAVVRSAREGRLTVSDAYGRVTADSPSGPQTIVNVRVPLDGPEPTLYGRIGDVFGWLCLMLSAVFIGWGAVRKRAGLGGANVD